MTISPQMSWKSASSLEDISLDPATLGYFHGLAQSEAHAIVLSLFQSLSGDKKITRAFIARRLDKSPEQVTRWLSAPGNWTLDTLTNLLLAMGHRPKFSVEKLSDIRQSNYHHHAVSMNLTDALNLTVTPKSDDSYALSTRMEDGPIRVNKVEYRI